MSRTVYVVMGSEGQYSDYRTWVVAVHTTGVAARAHAERAQARAEANKETRREWYEKHEDFDGMPVLANPHDPDNDPCADDYDVHEAPFNPRTK